MKTTKMKTRIAAILAAMICATSAVGGSMVSAADISNAPSASTSTFTTAKKPVSARDELTDYIYNKIQYNKANLSKEIYKQKVYQKCDLKDGTMTVSSIKDKKIDEKHLIFQS